MAKAKTKKPAGVNRRQHLRYLLDSNDSILSSVKSACGSSWNEASPKTVNGHMAEALSYAEKLSCGSVWTESLPEISKLIRGKDEEGLNEAIRVSMGIWIGLFEETHDLSEVPGWTDFQVGRCWSNVDWFGTYLARVVSPVTKNGKTKKRGKAPKASKPKAKPKAKKAKPDASEARLDALEAGQAAMQAGQAEMLALLKDLRS